MNDRPPLHTTVQEILDWTFVQNKFIYIDLWSIVHLISGLLLGMVLVRYSRSAYALAWAVTLILAYEVVELALNDVLFYPETPVDLLWDVIVGFAGTFAAIRIAGRRSPSHQKRPAKRDT
jgi:hypothetical protein